jgi:hypothetical protein
MWEGIFSILIGVLCIVIIYKDRKEIGKGDYEGWFNFDTKGYVYSTILILIGIYILISSL